MKAKRIVIYYRETVDLVGLPAARPTPPCEYTLEEVTRGVTFSDWAAWVDKPLSDEQLRAGYWAAWVDKPLTNEQLRAGDWYCMEVSADVTQLLIDKDISYCIEIECRGMYVKYATPIDSKPTKEIIRRGNEFYYV